METLISSVWDPDNIWDFLFIVEYIWQTNILCDFM